MKEILFKGTFYFWLPALVTLNEGLNGITQVTYSVQDMRVLVLIPLICGLSTLRAFIDRSYAQHRANGKAKPNETTVIAPVPPAGA